MIPGASFLCHSFQQAHQSCVLWDVCKLGFGTPVVPATPSQMREKPDAFKIEECGGKKERCLFEFPLANHVEIMADNDPRSSESAFTVRNPQLQIFCRNVFGQHRPLARVSPQHFPRSAMTAGRGTCTFHLPVDVSPSNSCRRIACIKCPN